jgi:hypothetical protein
MLVNEAAAIAVACIFGVLLVGALANFRITNFRIYLLSGLSTLLRVVGFSFNAAYFNVVSKGTPPNNSFFACFFVLAGAGQAIAFAVHILTMTSWFKNSSPTSQPPFAEKLNLRIAVRWLILPIITFGPILGICYATLVYGFPTPSHLEIANKLRLASSWGIFIDAVLVTSFAGIAVYYSTTSRKRGGKEPQVSQDRMIWISLLCCLLLLIAVIFSLVAFYQPYRYARNPNFYYTLIVLPALIEQVIVTIPRLLARVALGSRYDAFCKERDELKVEKKLGGVLNLFKTFRKTASATTLDVKNPSTSKSSSAQDDGSGLSQEEIV